MCLFGLEFHLNAEAMNEVEYTQHSEYQSVTYLNANLIYRMTFRWGPDAENLYFNVKLYELLAQ